MFGKIIDGRLIEMQSDGKDDKGCLYVIDTDHAYDYAKSNGYKEIRFKECPDDGKEYVQQYIEYEEYIECTWMTEL